MSSTEENWRVINLNAKEPSSSLIYRDNSVSSARYSYLTFVPKNLFEQFQRSANIWFLVVSVFQLMPFQFNPTDSWTTALPLSILVLFTFFKDTYDDYYRRKKDSAVNAQKYSRWNGTEFETVECRNIQVGDLVVVSRSQFVPCDMLFLAGSNEESYVDNSGIMGERGLKLRTPLEYTQSQARETTEMLLKKLEALVKAETPNPDFSSFNVKVSFKWHPKAVQAGVQNSFYRGSTLQGTPWALGLAVYTGSETKTQLNTLKAPKKTSRIEKTVNKWVLLILLVLLGLVVFSCIAYYSLSQAEHSERLHWVQSLIVFTLLYNNVIPISLFVTMDLSKVLQILFIQKHLKVEYKTSDINEDMGQVEYVVCDKTGTITENELVVRTCFVGSKKYLREETPEPQLNSLFEKPQISDPTLSTKPKSPFGFESLKKDFQERSQDSKLHHFVKCMALCNSVYPQESGKLKYLGISADETALVEAAGDLGVNLCSRTKTSCVLNTEEEYSILAHKDFKPEIRKSRVLVRKGSETLLYVKGALDSMLPLIDSSKHSKLESQVSHLEELRTIVLGYKMLTEKEREDFLQKIQNAKNFPVNIEGRIEMVFAEYEKDLNLLGVVGIEDLVLPETQNTIQALQSSGIKIWMLSGDTETSTFATALKARILKQETALVNLKNIESEYECSKTLQKAIEVYIHGEQNVAFSRMVSKKASEDPASPELSDSFSNIRSQTENVLSIHPIFQKITKLENQASHSLQKPFFESNVNYSLMLDRKSLQVSLESHYTRKLLAVLMFAAKSVCCYGLLPKDKAKVVKLLKENLKFKPVTLAIGDGNSDIAMIQEADIGVGLQAKEESQAANYSDLAISHFCQLKEMLLVHGHWNYSRISRVVLLFFYKNFALIFLMFLFCFFSDYSGTNIFSPTFLMSYNLLFTSLPVLVLGVFDQDFPELKLLKQLGYTQGIKGELFNSSKLLKFTAKAILHSSVVFGFVYMCFSSSLNESGFTENLELFGASLYSVVVLTVLGEIFLETHCYTVLYLLSQLLSVGFLVLAIVLLNYFVFTSDHLLGIGRDIGGSLKVVLVTLVSPFLCFVVSYSFKAYSTVFKPTSKVSSETSNFSRLNQYSSNIFGCYKESNSWNANSEKQGFSIQKYSLHFNSPYIEKEYRSTYIEEHITLFRIIIGVLWVLLVLWTMLESVLFDASLTYSLMRVLMCIAFSVVLFLSFLEHFKHHYVKYTLAIIGVSLLVKFGVELAFGRVGTLAAACVPAITNILFGVDFLKILGLNVLSILLTWCQVFFFLENSQYEGAELLFTLLSYSVIGMAISATSTVVGYALEYSRREEHKLAKIKESEIQKAQGILSFLLPSFVKKRVKDGKRYIAEDQGVVTVLFCDICDFDAICAEYTPLELTCFLDSLFQKFDQLCEVIGLTKIETVGKTYMACAGLKDSEAEIEDHLKLVSHSRRAVELGMAMINTISSFKLKNGKDLKVKIGINSGPVTAGVVGYHKPQFSLVGDTVNTASRMCSTIQKCNNIQISESTYQLIGDTQGLEFTQKTVEAKGKGTLTTYLVSESSYNEIETLKLDTSFLQSSRIEEKSPSRPRNSVMLEQLEIRQTRDIFKKRRNTETLPQAKILNCNCTETPKQKQFRIQKVEKNHSMMFVGLIIAAVTYGVLFLVSLLKLVLTENSLEVVILRGIVLGFIGLLACIQKKASKFRLYAAFMILVVVSMLVVSLMYIIIEEDRENDLVALEVMYIILTLAHTTGLSVAHISWTALLIFVPWVVLTFFNSDFDLHLANSLFVVGFSVINLCAVYSRERRLRIYFNLADMAQKEIQKTNELLKQMVPPRALENMKQEKAITDKLKNVTLLYADIVGFTAWSSDKSPKEVVEMLSHMFREFDKSCVDLNVYKVHTIGDCYVVMSYVESQHRDEALECFNMVKMAQRMLEIIQKVNEECGSELNMRIGLHTGKVIAGIIGTHIVRYDIYGPDVLIANKMESGGEAGKINVSDRTKELLESKFPFFNYELNKQVEVKCINRVHNSYFLSVTKS